MRDQFLFVTRVVDAPFECKSRDVLKLGDQSIYLTNHESAIFIKLMHARAGLTKAELLDATQIPSSSLFDQIYNQLITKLSEVAIANYGGNGSFYDETIYACELLNEREGKIIFNHDLLRLIDQFGDILNDEALHSIRFQPRAYRPIFCCR